MELLCDLKWKGIQKMQPLPASLILWYPAAGAPDRSAAVARAKVGLYRVIGAASCLDPGEAERDKELEVVGAP